MGDYVFEGDFKLGNHDMYFASGTSIVKFPEKESHLVKKSLNNQGKEILVSQKENIDEVPILGLYHPSNVPSSNPNGLSTSFGRLAIYGDSNCLDNAHLQKDCFWMLEALLQFTTTGNIPDLFKQDNIEEENIKSNVVDVNNNHHDTLLKHEELPERMENNNLHRYSKVLEHHLGNPQTRPLPSCPSFKYETPIPLNKSAPSNLFKSQKLFSVSGIDIQLPFPQQKQDNFEHYQSSRWETATLLTDFKDTDVRFSFLTTICLFILVVVAILVIKQFHFRSSKPRKRRSRTTVRRLLLQLPSRVPTV